MIMMGLCQKCGRPGIQHTCHLCGCIVCDHCFDIIHDVCKQCLVGKKFNE